MSGRADRARVGAAPPALEAALADLARATDLEEAARCLIGIGAEVGLPSPAVIDDYSTNRVLTVDDGRAIASVLGWEEDFQRAWLDQRLYLISPIAAVCRVSTRPFVWDAAAVAQAVLDARHRPQVMWNLTPENGIYGGVTVPIHLPHARTGSVGWLARDPEVDIQGVLARYGGTLRLAAHLMMDLVYARRAENADDPEPASSLNEREIECLSWSGLGRTDVEIGAIIHRSPATARFHIDSAIGKLGARNRTQAVAIAAQLGLIHPFDDRRSRD
ncbi:MAG: autoinducer binding domain-containing protein [Pseudomonadales bacterium]